MTTSDKTKLVRLVSKNKLREVINHLLEFETKNNDYHAISSRMADYEEKLFKGIARAEDLEVQRNQITEAILNLIEKIVVVDVKTEQDNEDVKEEKGEASFLANSNSIDMKAYEFYFSIRDHLLTFINASQNWRLGMYRDDQNRAEAIGEISLQLLKLKNHLELNHLEDSLMFELSTLGIELLESAENELLSLVTGKKTSSTGLKLKLNNIQKKLIELVLEIDKKLHIDQASKG